MGRPYHLELLELAQTYEWAVDCSIRELEEAIQDLRDHPFIAIGSGGSLTAAAFWSMVQEEWTGMPSKQGTPLDLLALPSTSNYAIGLASARGSNPDIVKAFESAALGESKGLVAITFAHGSKLDVSGKKYPWARIVTFRPPVARDGFLATNSLLSFMVLIHRAYAAAAGSELNLPARLPEPQISGALSEPAPETYSILHAGWSSIAARDMESKLVEAGLADVHYADLRNFAHGRHHWLARRGETTTVVALVTPEWSGLLNKTLALLPPGTNTILIKSSNDGPLGAIELVVGGLRLVGQIASQQAFDPGKPDVPEFGRRLYHLSLNSIGRRDGKPSTDLLLSRKLGGPTARWSADAIATSTDALDRYLETLRNTTFHGVVFDYDETLCPAANRFSRLPDDIAVALTDILAHDVALGIASGRGRSVGHSIRESLDRSAWDRVIVGYYNGGCVLRLSEGDPANMGEMAPELTKICDLLHIHPLLPEICDIEPRPYQVTLTPLAHVPLTSVLKLVLELVAVSRLPGIAVTRSSHSIDILGPGVSKLSVVEACLDQMAEKSEEARVLRIGDSGSWSGNDLHLLSTPFSLSVADCPMNLSWAWNLALPGHKGCQAALDYINCMKFSHGSFSLDINRLVGRIP